MATGKIVQVIGTVVDVEFPPDGMPSVYNALEAKSVTVGLFLRWNNISETTG